MSTFSAYLVTPAAGARQWGTVKADAERLARELGGECTSIAVPATKAALVPFLNELEAFHAGDTPTLIAIAPLEAAELDELRAAPHGRIVPAPAPIGFAPAPGNVDALVDWLLEHAPQRDVERLFEALGCRFGELARKARPAL